MSDRCWRWKSRRDYSPDAVLARSLHAVIDDWERGVNADTLTPSEAEPFHRFIRHLRAALAKPMGHTDAESGETHE